MVLTGNSLLVGDVGRPDFGGGDAAAQYESLTRAAAPAGLGGGLPRSLRGPLRQGDVRGRPSTTIGFERLYIPLVRMDREPFVSD